MSTQIVCDWCEKVVKEFRAITITYFTRHHYFHICSNCSEERGIKKYPDDTPNEAKKIINDMIELIVEEVGTRIQENM